MVLTRAKPIGGFLVRGWPRSLSTSTAGSFFCQSPRDPCNFLSRKPRRGFNAPLSQPVVSSPPSLRSGLHTGAYYCQFTPTILTMNLRGSHPSDQLESLVDIRRTCRVVFSVEPTFGEEVEDLSDRVVYRKS